MITKNKEINKNAKSNLAKLLATENISVEHKKVRTAYFDLKNRLLVVPIWKDMNKDILDLLLSHEIGHALFTDMNEWRVAVEEEKIPHSFLNVVEDARIEKLVKRKYPGLSQTFIKGYRDLIANDFFKTKDRNINDMLLIDRLNMHFKSSYVESDIEFSEPELDIVNRMKNLETFDDVKKLAKELADYSNEEAETKQMNDVEFDENGDPLDLDSEDSDEEGESNYAEEENEEEENENEGNSETDTTSSESDNDKEEEQKDPINRDLDSSNNSGTQSDTITDESIPQDPNQVQPETDDAWQETSKKLLDSKCKDNEYFNIHEYKNLKDYVVDYKELLQKFKSNRLKSFKQNDAYKSYYNELILDYKKFTKNQNKAVGYMVKEFEMKKAAHAYSRSKQDKSGVVDPLKLHGYKYNDDIFKRLTLLPDGKNHGLMMFIDWSGSMGDKLTATIHQLMNLTMFCKKVQIPFEVYAFSNNTSYRSDNNYSDKVSYPEPTYENNDVSVDTHMILFNFVSSRMNATEYDQGMTNLYYLGIKHESERNYYRQRNMSYINGQRIEDEWKYNLHGMPRGMNLSSTPLNDCIMAAMKMVPAFQKKYNIDKMNTVFLTDGHSDGNGRKVVTDPQEIQKLMRSRDYYNNDKDTPTVKTKHLPYDSNHILVDKQTKKQTLISDYRYSLTDALLKALKERTHSKVIGFYIESRGRLSRYTLDQYYPEYNFIRDVKKKTFNRKLVMAEFRKNKCLVVKDNTGYDELYLLVADNMKVVDGQMATPSANAKKGEIKRLFASTLKSNRNSRVVLNKFISQVA